ncbi:UNVERIFIED_CONTAM: hypothetical protein FKN15_012824 [Acipenser sinensis]
MANYYGRLTATTPALTREGEDEHTLSSEACTVKPTAFFFTLQTHHAATQELQRRRTTQLSGSYRQARRRPARLQGSLVRDIQVGYLGILIEKSAELQHFSDPAKEAFVPDNHSRDERRCHDNL